MVRIWLAIALTGCEAIFPLEPPPPATPIADCSNTESLVDDFEGPLLDPAWRATHLKNNGSNALLHTTHEVEMRLAANFTGELLETAAHYDLTGRKLSIAIINTDNFGPLGGDNFVELELGLPGFVVSIDNSGNFVAQGDAVAMRAQGEELQIGRYQAGAFATLRTLPFDPLTRHVWQIEERDGLVIWSIDGEPLQSLALEVGVVRPRVVAYQGASGAFNTLVDDVNRDVTQSPICGARGVTEDFETDLDPAVWSERQNTGCSLVARAGQLVADETGDGMMDDCFVRTGRPSDLHDNGFAIQLDQLAPSIGHSVYAKVELRLAGAIPPQDGAAFAGFEIDGNGMLHLSGSQRPEPYLSIPYDQVAHQFLRIRAAPDPVTMIDQLIWEVSADGSDYGTLPLFQNGDYVNLDQARLTIGIRGDASPIGELAVAGVNAD